MNRERSSMAKRAWTKQQLKQAIKSSYSYSETLQHLGLVNRGGNFATIKKHIDLLGLDTSHFVRRTGQFKPGHKHNRVYTNNEMFIKDRRFNTGVIKSRILADNLLQYMCTECNNKGYHNSKKLVLQLDHINGDSSDNRLSNLRFLCPNCHSQTETFSGLVNQISTNKWYGPKYNKRKCDHDAVCKRFNEINNYTRVGKEFDISDNAVRKIVNKKYKKVYKTKRIRKQ